MVDIIDTQLIAMLQSGFPLVRRPFYQIGKMLGLSTAEVMGSIDAYKKMGVIREISAIVNPHSLGYNTTLVALQVPVRLIDRCSEPIGKHPLISHAYLRNHSLNLWITLAVNKKHNAQDEIETISRSCSATEAVNLPSVKLYKLKAVFDESDGCPQQPLQQGHTGIHELTATQKEVLKAIQCDLPLVPAPFDQLSSQIGITAEEFLDVAKELESKGIIKRYGANINHRGLGYSYNAMTCFSVDGSEADRLGYYLSRQKQVSHCYLRQPHQLFTYNLYAMIHCSNEADYESFMRRTTAETGHNEYLSLVSEKEIKKTRNRYNP